MKENILKASIIKRYNGYQFQKHETKPFCLLAKLFKLHHPCEHFQVYFRVQTSSCVMGMTKVFLKSMLFMSRHF
jgi:hypothetical protein